MYVYTYIHMGNTIYELYIPMATSPDDSNSSSCTSADSPAQSSVKKDNKLLQEMYNIIHNTKLTPNVLLMKCSFL